MSTSKGLGTDFDAWLAKAFRKGPFTALIVLVRIAELVLTAEQLGLIS